MDFTLSTEQNLLRETVRRYCHDRYRFQERQAILRSPEGFSREHWRAFGELGWIGAALPEDVGGAGGSAIETALIAEELGRALVLEPYRACAVLAGHVVDLAARPGQRQELLPPLIRGDLLIALAHGEPEARGDLRWIETRATRTASGSYVLNGRKSLVAAGASADLLIVSARGAGDPRDPHGVSLFLVRPEARGLERRPFRTIDGTAAADLRLDDVTVEAAAQLAAGSDALIAIEDAIDRTLTAACAEAVGAMDRVVTSTRDYLVARRAYGTTLSTLQALQHRLADMLVELELSRSALYRALAALASWERPERRAAVAMAKALIGGSGRVVGAEGIQLHGGMGVSDDYVISHLFKRLTAIEALFGAGDVHLTRVASGEGASDAHPVPLEC